VAQKNGLNAGQADVLRGHLSRRAILRALAVTGLGAVGLSSLACQAQVPASPAPPTSAPTQAAPATPTQPPAAAGDTLRIASSALGNESMDPTTSDVGNKLFFTLAYDWLVDINANSEPDPSRSVAERWEITPDNRTFTFTIRKGIKFQNGDDLTAEDVQFSLQRITGDKSQSAYAGNLKKAIASVDLVDPYTVRIQTRDSNIFLLYDLSPLIGNEGVILPKKYITANGDDVFRRAPVGSGPYQFVAQQSGDNIQFQAFNGYWRSRALKYKQIAFRSVPEEQTRAALLQRGDVDIIDASPRKAQDLEQSGLRKVIKPGGYAVTALLTEQWLPPFDNPMVRQALNIAIDRNGLNRSLFGGLAQVTANYPINSLDLGYFAEPLYDYDPARAKQMLAAAGEPNPKITMYSYPRAGIAGGPQMMEAIAGMWQAVGAQVAIRSTDYGAFRTMWQQHSQGPGVACYINAGGQVVGVGRLSSILGATGILTINKDPKLDEFIASAATSPDLDAYKQRMKTLADFIRQNDITAPLFELGDIYVTSAKITPWAFTRTAFSWDLLNVVS
jgi:peptide/nickel transport system substrate-binding protein